MDIFFKIKGIKKEASKSIEENAGFQRKLYVAYLNETYFESVSIENQTYSTYILKKDALTDEMDKLPFILSLQDQLLLNEIEYTD